MPSVESVERYERLKRRQELKAQREESDTECDGNNEDEYGIEIEGNTGSIKCTDRGTKRTSLETIS